MARQIEQVPLPAPVRGGCIHPCENTVDMFHLKPEDFVPQVDKVLTVGEFYELSAGTQVIFT